MTHPRHTQRAQRIPQDLLAPAIVLDDACEEEGERDVLGEVGLRAEGGGERVVRGAGGGWGDGGGGLDAVVDDAVLEEEVVGCEGGGEGGGYGEVEAEGCRW